MKRLVLGVALGLMMASLSMEAAAIGPTFFNGFETDTAGWCENDPVFSSIDPLCTGSNRGTITQVADGYVSSVPYASGIFSAAGTHHARLRRPTNCETQQAGGGPVNRCRGPYTEWNNSDYNFPTGGFSTQVDVYLNVGYASANPDCYSCDDSRYDFSSAISTPTGNHLRDFVFNVGTAPNGDTSICANGGFVVSASQNANRDSTYPSNLQKEPQCIAASAWYTFRHTFFDNGGNLAVDMDILNASGQTVASWQLPNRSSATRGDAVDPISEAGCALYGYFSNQEIQDLAIDNSQMDGCGVKQPTVTTQLSETSGINGDTITDQATLSGATEDAGGTVTYSVYTDDVCSGQGVAAGTKTVTNGAVGPSDPVTFNTPGTYYWQASYSGDDHNKPATSDCSTERLEIVQQVAKIAPTQTTCQQYADGTAATLGQLAYTSKGTVIGSVAPGVFFYYAKVSGSMGDYVMITESHTGTAPPIPILKGQVALYSSTCTTLKWRSLTVVDSDGTAIGVLPSTGNFIIGVKYSPSALRSKQVPSPPTVTYNFETGLNAVPITADLARINLVPKF